MEPELWEQVEEVFHQTLALEESSRAEFLAHACGQNSVLRREVESLLALEKEAEHFIESPALEVMGRLAAADPGITGAGAELIGATISHYRVIDKLGGGGMGVVYKAEDTRLHRFVALKFLPEGIADDPKVLERFAREARAASSLDHPNICTIYEFGEHEGRLFIAMSLLEGQTLRDRIAATAAPSAIGELLKLGIQIGDGLAAAHEKGIIHRDIKPANIFITNRNEAKILDFGLAKLTAAGTLEDVRHQEARLQEPQTALAHDLSLTGDLNLSRTGAAMGTVPYMSPEQIRGEKLDARTDLYSFGLVLYEMATGKRAFSGDTADALYEAILNRRPVPVRELNPELPPKLEEIINKALEKDREARYQTGAEMCSALKELNDGTDRRQQKKSPGLILAGLLAAALVTVIGGFLFLRETGKHGESSRGDAHLVPEQRVTSNPPEAPVRDAVVSPDGEHVAYTDPTGLYLRQISTGETHPLPLPKGFVAWSGSWFPDSTHLLVVHLEGEGRIPGVDWQPSLWKVSLSGDDPHMIRDNASAGAVSPDGTRIAYLPDTRTTASSELWLMDSDGENARRGASTDRRDQTSVRSSGTGAMEMKPNAPDGWIYPQVWSPSGQRLAYIERHVVAAPNPAGPAVSIRTINADGSGSTVVLDDPRIGPALWWVPDGRILYAYREDAATEGNNYGVYSIGVDERSGKAIGKPQQITNAEGFITGMSATSNGKRLVLWRENTSMQAFITELDPISRQWKAPRRLTLDTNDNMAEAWTADSKAVLFVSNRNGTWKLFKQNIDETTPEVLVEGRSIYLPRVSADGSQALYLAGSKPGDTSFPASLMSKPLAGGPPRLVLQEKGIINYECARAPSKLCIFSKLVGQDLIFISFDLEHGAGRELTRIPNGYTNWGLSPDGSKLAVFLDSHRIRFISLSTGATKDEVVKEWPLMRGGDWSADSKSVFMRSLTPQRVPVILAVNEAGKTEVVLEGQPNTDFGFLIQSPDGRHAILEMPTLGDNNAWMVDVF